MGAKRRPTEQWTSRTQDGRRDGTGDRGLGRMNEASRVVHEPREVVEQSRRQGGDRATEECRGRMKWLRRHLGGCEEDW
ncbi:hypothetical protein NDU88_001806 [Pleurodeles waltl]|uniref:Uncharacterized protein n=1 Tax=Pleurodeles waltl TaxID=8319 RepID=A0AAV7KZJ6_PLEWA|nr:hypothetical protein NDU88_001806 [Pleurodeles waltl]